MTDFTKTGGGTAALMRDSLHEAQVLQARIGGLKALLQLQRWQFAKLEERLHRDGPAGTAARRLLALKQAERSWV